MAEPMTHERLDELVDTDPIRLRDEAFSLLAKVDRLRKQVEEQGRALDQVTKERDEYHDLLDRFAYTIAHPDLIGLHSSSNDPWAKALDMVTPAAEVARLLQLVKDASVFFSIARLHMPDLMAEFERVRAELNRHAPASSGSPSEPATTAGEGA